LIHVPLPVLANTSWLIVTFDTDGEVIFAEGNPSGTQLIERAPKRAFVLIGDFASSITFGEGQLLAQWTARRWLASPLIHKEFRDDHPCLTRGNVVSLTPNHQK
jgi:hypothetical protein